MQAAVDTDITVAEGSGDDAGKLVFSDAAGRDFANTHFAVVSNTAVQAVAVASTATVAVTDPADVSSITVNLGGTDVTVNAAAIASATNIATLITAVQDAMQAAVDTDITVAEGSGDDAGKLVFSDAAGRDFTNTNFAVLKDNNTSDSGAVFTDGDAGAVQNLTLAADSGAVFTDGDAGAVQDLTLAADSGKVFTDGVAGNEYSAAVFSDSYVGAYDTITGFTVGTDKIDLLTSLGGAVAQPTSLERFSDVDGSTVTTGQNLIDSVLNSGSFSALTANQAGIIVVTSGDYAGAYLYVNDSVDALDSGTDIFIKLVGTTGLGDVGSLTASISDYFVA
jgi:hypothetical protein